MNDTTRDELREQVAAALHDFWRDVYVFEYGDGRQKPPSVAATAERIIALVTAARDAEIREALESEVLVAMFARMMWTQDDKPTATPSSSYYMAARYNLDTIVKHIGLGDGAGGQG